MKPGGGKAKGSAFEREVCKELSLWMSGGTRDDLYWRSAMSGGRASVQFKKGGGNVSQTGDICSIDPAGAPLTSTFFIECKFYADLNLEGAIIGNQGGIAGMWQECVEKAKEQGGKLPFLVAKQNRTRTMLWLSPEGTEMFALQRFRRAMLPQPMNVDIVWWESFLQFSVNPWAVKAPPLRKRL